MNNLLKKVNKRLKEGWVMGAAKGNNLDKLANNKIIIAFSFIVIVFFLYWYFIGFESENGKYDSFARCLTEKGVVMYGTDWCVFCREQKNMFGNSFRFINYVNCDPYNNKQQIDECKKENIRVYPTWKIKDKKIEGLQPLDVLSEVSNCSLFA